MYPAKSKKRLKAALYARVSTKFQIDGDSLPMQRDDLPKYAEYALGITDYELFVDAGYSAKNTDRPDYQRMMKRIREGEFTHLIVWKIDRISRNLLDFASMYQELKQLGVTFISKNEQFDTSTAIGEAMLKIILVFAELERNMTSERVTATMRSRAQNGQWNGGKVPFGYTYHKDTGTFSINEDESHVILTMFDQYERMHSLLQVANFLNARHIFTRSGHAWSGTSVYQVLINPFCSGTYVYNRKHDTSGKSGEWKDKEQWVRIPDHHPAIITPARQAAILKILRKNSRSSPAVKTYERKNIHIFAGLITCGCCGSHYQSSISSRPAAGMDRNPSVYLCASRRRTKSCINPSVTDMTVGPFIFNLLANYIRLQSNFGRSTSVPQTGKKLLRGDVFNGCSLTPDSAQAVHAYLRRTKFALEPFSDSSTITADADQDPESADILFAERRRLDRALQRLKSLFLFDDSTLTEADFIAQQKDLLNQIARINTRLSDLHGIQPDEPDVQPLTISEYDRASYVLLREEMLGTRYINFPHLVSSVDRRVCKIFINMSILNICVKWGKIREVTMKNGLKFTFQYDDD